MAQSLATSKGFRNTLPRDYPPRHYGDEEGHYHLDENQAYGQQGYNEDGQYPLDQIQYGNEPPAHYQTEVPYQNNEQDNHQYDTSHSLQEPNKGIHYKSKVKQQYPNEIGNYDDNSDYQSGPQPEENNQGQLLYYDNHYGSGPSGSISQSLSINHGSYDQNPSHSDSHRAFALVSDKFQHLTKGVPSPSVYGGAAGGSFESQSNRQLQRPKQSVKQWGQRTSESYRPKLPQ